MTGQFRTVIFICNEYPPVPGGGIGVVVKTLAEALSKRGVKVVVLGYDPSIEHDIQVEESGVSVFRLYDRYEKRKPFRVGRYYISLSQFRKRLLLSRRLNKLIVDFKPDFIESYDWSGPLWSKPSVPLLVRMHGAHTAYNYFEKRKSSKLLRFFERRNLLMADAVCAVSRHIGEMTCEAFELKINFSVIYNFVDVDRFKRIPDISRDFHKILYVGRIEKRKGVVELFKVLDILFDLNQNVYCELAGPVHDLLKTELLSFIKITNHHRIKFLGRVPHDELPSLYNTTGVFVMPSRAEAFGLTAAEAMACSTAVILTNRASAPEIVIHGESGLLLDFNDPQKGASLINSWIVQVRYLNELGEKARERVLKEFSTEVQIEKNVSFYNAVVSGRQEV